MHSIVGDLTMLVCHLTSVHIKYCCQSKILRSS